jgi:bacillithiol biosynthesis cysteine-adding enzyme BshC
MSGESPLKAHCLPFQQVPHSSRLFLDFLQGAPGVKPFYPRSAPFSSWFRDETSKVQYDGERRRQVAAALERQNKAWGASSETLANIERLKNGAFAVVTGQQVGLFGGPTFALYKALSAVKLAEEATKGGVDCVPVFWLATQDHDLDEVNQTSFPVVDGQWKKLSGEAEGANDAPVGHIKFTPEISAQIDAVAEAFGDSECVTLLRDAYRAGESFGSAFAKLLARLFGEWGVILMDASDPEIAAMVTPVFGAAIERASELEQKLTARGKALEAAGYHQQVKVSASSTLVFGLKDGARLPVQRSSSSSDTFAIGDEKLSRQELLEKIKSRPQDFSANVLLRPVVQDYLLPTLAYTGGSAETAYFAQAAVVYETLAGRVTPIIPRFSATVIETKPGALMEKYGLSFVDITEGPEAVKGRLASHTLPKELQSAFDEAGAGVTRSMAKIGELLGRLDKTLVEAANNAGSKMDHQIESLRSRAAKAEMRQSEVLGRHADILSNLLYPAKSLQEREIGSIYFIGRYGKQFLHDLYGVIQMDCPDHQILTL